MILAVGDIVRVDFPGNGLHGQRVRVERVKPEFDIAHPDCPEGPMIVEVIFISHPSLPEPVGIGRSHIAGTLENARWYGDVSLCVPRRQGYGTGRVAPLRDRLWSLWEMIDLKLKPLLDAQDVVANWSNLLHAGNGANFPNGVGKTGREGLIEILEPLIEQLRRDDEFKMCRLAGERLIKTLKSETDPRQIVSALDDLRRRLLDQGNEMSCLWLSSVEREWYEPKEPLFGSVFAGKFTSDGAFELEEAAKCLALERATAAVFHLMRLMEIGVMAVARCLDIPDPLHGGDRNWGSILGKIKNGIAAKWAPAARLSGEGATFEALYASLDAVKNPWRNATMHPANKYTQKEAENIFSAVRGFMTTLADRCDENGDPKA